MYAYRYCTSNGAMINNLMIEFKQVDFATALVFQDGENVGALIKIWGIWKIKIIDPKVSEEIRNLVKAELQKFNIND